MVVCTTSPRVAAVDCRECPSFRGVPLYEIVWFVCVGARAERSVCRSGVLSVLWRSSTYERCVLLRVFPCLCAEHSRYGQEHVFYLSWLAVSQGLLTGCLHVLSRFLQCGALAEGRHDAVMLRAEKSVSVPQAPLYFRVPADRFGVLEHK